MMEEEKKLIASCRRGDEAAFEALMRLHEKRVYALCCRMCGNEQDALEAAQDTFFALWRGIGGFRGDAALSTWLYRLAVNACVDLLRRRKRAENDVPLDDGAALPPDPASEPPQKALERKEAARLVREGMLALPEEYRAVLILREVEQLSYDEIAAATGLAPGTVKSRLNRARAKLRDGLLRRNGNFFETAPSKETETQPAGKRGKPKKGKGETRA